MRGRPTTAGVANLEMFGDTASVVRRLEEAGAILLGKTQTAELAAGAHGINLPLGTPLNPHCASVAPGGSSSGAAACCSACLHALLTRAPSRKPIVHAPLLAALARQAPQLPSPRASYPLRLEPTREAPSASPQLGAAS